MGRHDHGARPSDADCARRPRRIRARTDPSAYGRRQEARQSPWRAFWPSAGKEAMQRLAEGAVQADLARSYGVSQATISRLAAPSPFAEGAAVAQ